MTVKIDSVIGALQVPEDAELVYSGSASLVDLPLEAGTYYLTNGNFLVNGWQKITVNPELYNTVNYIQSEMGLGRAVAGSGGLLGIIAAEVQKIDDSTMRFRLYAYISFTATYAKSARSITRIMKAK